MKRRGSRSVGVLVSVCLFLFPGLVKAQGNSPGGGGLAQELAALQARMTAAETRLSSAEARLSAAETAVSALTTQSANQAGQIAALQAKTVPVGTIITYSAETPPAGYLECDGTEVSRAGYPALFAAIGTAWGEGDGASTFLIPDLRGLFQRGWSHDSPRGFDPDRLNRFRINPGGAFGDHVGSLQESQLQQHQHTVTSAGSDFFGPFRGIIGGNGSGFFSNLTTGVIGHSGAETRPYNATVMYAIKY